MPRDYHKAYEQIKDKKKLIGVQVYTQTAEDFKAKCYLNETTPNAFLKACIAVGTQPDFFVYPGEPHNMRGHQSTHLHERISRYFDDYLKW